MRKIKLSEKLEISPIIHGLWRLASWNLSNRELLKLIEQTNELGITTYDHADIYGNYTCEKLFGDALNLNKNIRKNIQIITKCGIKLLSDKFPERQIKTYDYSYEHIIKSAENSLSNFKTDYIDLLLLHRPAPFFNPEEVAKAFEYLKNTGKVLNFGVSNFNPLQFEMLNSYLDNKLVTNQVQISPYCLESFENGNIDFFLKQKIKPIAWSPLAFGKLFEPTDEKSYRIYLALNEVANQLNINDLDKIIYIWILKHPSSIIPITGSGKIERIKSAVNSLNIKMTDEQWYKIYNASTGLELP